ncbi:MAG: hypothetical protein K0R48_200 [Gammaproteobacteria bacterium]|nr:hypothetical protein [Gammaproteobacteria bacterium]
MTAYFASNQDPFSKLIKPKNPIQGTFNLSEPSSHSQNDEHLLSRAVLVFSCYTFIPEMKGRVAGNNDDDSADDEESSQS